jgi:hypothetical protein
MRVEDIRTRVVEKVAEAGAGADEESTASILDFSRALLVALASWPPDIDVDLDALTVKTGTAALILRLHREYVRELIRRRELRARKENGEFQIPLAEVMDFHARNFKLGGGSAPLQPMRHMHRLLERGPLGLDLWQGAREEPKDEGDADQQGAEPA